MPATIRATRAGGGYGGDAGGSGGIDEVSTSATRKSVFDDAVGPMPGAATLLKTGAERRSEAERRSADVALLHEELQQAEMMRGIDSPVSSSQEDHVYLTNAYREWERHYLKKIAKRIHRMVCAELAKEEEALFMLFVSYDQDLNGVIEGSEAQKFLDAIEEAAPGSSDDSPHPASNLLGDDGAIAFMSLVRWFTDTEKCKTTTMMFSLSSMTVSFVGSGNLTNDSRIDALTREQLQRNVVGYRRLLQQIRSFNEERALAPAREKESEDGIEAAMPVYYQALFNEFEGDWEHLFELFSEADESGDMMLEEREVAILLRNLDAGASDQDVARYIAEINLSEGPLNFASLLDWWDQARSVSNSLVAEKGGALIAAVKARGAQRRLSGVFMESCVQARWREAKEENRLQQLRQAYVRTVGEVRDYKQDRNLHQMEFECAQL